MAALEVGGFLMLEGVDGFHLFHEVELVPLPGEGGGGLDSCTRLCHRNRKSINTKTYFPFLINF